MSRHRRSPDAGWVYSKSKKLAKGPNGRNLCRQCGQEVPKGRRTFCDDGCVDKWRLKTDPGFVRSQVFKRDNGICAKCGRDTVAWRREIYGLPYWERRELVQRLGLANRHNLWDADHIVPVSEGGGECDLDNYQTLCVECHRAKTREMHGRRVRERRPEPTLPLFELLEATTV